MQWLRIKEGETVTGTIDLSSVKSIPKHWTGQRSELCLAEGCPHCLAGLSKRWRYHARLLIDKVPHQWEFGEQAMIELNAVPHDTNWANISITRVGDSRSTRYQVTQATPKPSYADIGAANAAAILARREHAPIDH